MFCSCAFDLGAEQTPAAVFALAEERFSRVIAATGAPADLRNLALVGRARARINQGKRTEAAADAALVPAGFVYTAKTTAAAGRAENRIFRFNNTNGTVTVDTQFRAQTVAGVADARVNVTDAGRGGSLPTVRLFVQNKYRSLSDPIPMATWLQPPPGAGGGSAVPQWRRHLRQQQVPAAPRRGALEQSQHLRLIRLAGPASPMVTAPAPGVSPHACP
jgi:hypothetical protein